ncbi:MAG: hypothetical protein VB025_09135 [Sphaerochaeta sp.]|nr:hypothetical protein [Sphaerochaeta sp.]
MAFLLVSTIVLVGCATASDIPTPVDIPSFEAVRPVPPVLEMVPQDSDIPDEMIRNYARLMRWAYDLEDYAWGGDEFGGLELYIDVLRNLLED